MSGEYQHIRHGFEPIYDESSRILILGTLPSVKSREQQFYYGHPQNRFWKLLAGLVEESNVPASIQEKTQFLLKHRIAIWDVIAECDIIGSSDSSIKNVVPADLTRILNVAPIQGIYANGTKAYELYMKYSYEKTGRKIEKLPSTSPANAAFQMERLLSAWGSKLSGFIGAGAGETF
ncbi:MAG: DNA-deoxyinosine glycosylase [Dorea sp.]|nr:DNA-deoxyinosine glycosylase [Dorea sp.]